MVKIYRFNEEYSKILEHKLNDVKLKYEIKNILGSNRIIFSIKDNLKYDKELELLIKNTPLIFNQFTKKELENANLLQIVPESQKISIINREECFETKCIKEDKFGIKRTYHHKQVGKMEINNVPKQDGCYLYSVDTGFSEIFVRKELVELIQKNNFKGFNISPIYVNKNEECEDLYQLLSDNIIKFEEIKKSSQEKIEHCPICHDYKKIIIDNTYQLHLNIKNKDLDSDFYMTDAVFGEGIPYRIYLVSQRFYQALQKENMNKKVKFIPVVLN